MKENSLLFPSQNGVFFKLECVIILLFKMLPQIRIFETFWPKKDFVHFCQPRLLFIDFFAQVLHKLYFN